VLLEICKTHTRLSGGGVLHSSVIGQVCLIDDTLPASSSGICPFDTHVRLRGSAAQRRGVATWMKAGNTSWDLSNANVRHQRLVQAALRNGVAAGCPADLRYKGLNLAFECSSESWLCILVVTHVCVSETVVRLLLWPTCAVYDSN
jgi:hypothetical protein